MLDLIDGDSIRDFVGEFQKRVKRIDKIESLAPIPENAVVRRYNVHKRSLPAGIDNIVVLNVTKLEAEWWIENKLKAKVYHNNAEDTKTIVYYDVVPVDASPKERSIYFNNHPVTTEEVPGFDAPKRIN